MQLPSFFQRKFTEKIAINNSSMAASYTSWLVLHVDRWLTRSPRSGQCRLRCLCWCSGICHEKTSSGVTQRFQKKNKKVCNFFGSIEALDFWQRANASSPGLHCTQESKVQTALTCIYASIDQTGLDWGLWTARRRDWSTWCPGSWLHSHRKIVVCLWSSGMLPGDQLHALLH